MNRLIWKEIREKIVIHFIISILSVFLILNSPRFLLTGYFNYGFFEYIIISFIGFYSSSVFLLKSKKTLLFLKSRPVSWLNLLIARMIPGIIIAIITPFMLLMFYYLAGYTQYINFYTLPVVSGKLYILVSHYLLSYIAGVLTDSILINRIDNIPAKPVIVPLAAVSLILVYFIVIWKIDTYIFIPVLAFAAIALLFWGLTAIYNLIIKNQNNDFNYNIIRFSYLCILIIFIHISAKNTFMSSYNIFTNNALISSRYSSDGKYVIANFMESGEGKRKAEEKIINTETGKRVIPSDSFNSMKVNLKEPHYYWLNNNLLLTYSITTNNDDNIIRLSFIYNVDNKITYPMMENMNVLSASDDGRFLLAKKVGNVKMNNYKNAANKIQRISIYTLPEMRKIREIRYLLSSKAPYWQDNKVVYINENGKQQFLQVK